MADFILHTTQHGATCSIHDLTRAQFDRFPGTEKEYSRADAERYWRKTFELDNSEVICYTDEAPVKSVVSPDLDSAGLFNLVNVPDWALLDVEEIPEQAVILEEVELPF